MKKKRRTIESILASARRHHNAGRFEEAIVDYRRILGFDPANSGILNLLGSVHHRCGDDRTAIWLMEKALLLRADGETYYGLGQAELALGSPDRAVAHLREAARLKPQEASVWSSLGAALLRAGWAADAAEAMKRSVALYPDAPLACFLLAQSLLSVSETVAAIGAYRMAISIEPNFPEALTGYGMALAACGFHRIAIDACQEAVRQRPGFARAHATLGTAYLRLSRLEEAEASFRRAVDLDPTSVTDRSNLATVLSMLGKDAEAARCWRSVLDRRPDDTEALSRYHATVRGLCAWEGLDVIEARMLDLVRNGAGGMAPGAVACISGALPEDVRAAASQAADRARSGVVPLPDPSADAERTRLRIAYLFSGTDDPVSGVPVFDVAGRHDRALFEVFGYAVSGLDQRERALADAVFDQVAVLRDPSDLAAAERIRSDGIDILIDLAGHGRRARFAILAYRPAPVQVAFPGPSVTTGADFVDYLMADAMVVPPGAEDSCTERIVRLPCLPLAVVREADGGPKATRAAFGLPSTGIVFSCLDGASRITPDAFAVWMRLLAAVPGAVLWLDAAEMDTVANLRAAAGAQGIDGQRIVFAPETVLPAERARRAALADLCLDTWPASAASAASAALGAGVPVISLPGRAPGGRLAASLLAALGLGDLIVSSADEYEALARDLARDSRKLGAVRDRLSRALATSAAADAEGYARLLEGAYLRMWETWIEGGAPEEFDVVPEPDDAPPLSLPTAPPVTLPSPLDAPDRAAPLSPGFASAPRTGGDRSAQAILPLVFGLVSPRSVVDAGCGAGAWLAAALERGVRDVLGLEGMLIPPDELHVPASLVQRIDLSRPFAVGRHFDLAISLDAASELPSERAAGFIDDLTRLAPAILFSAAAPLQMSADPRNEQWPSYWHGHFQRNGFLCFDILRDPLWGRADVDFTYVQNLLLFVREDARADYPALAGVRPVIDPAVLDRVHPRCLQRTVGMLFAEIERLRKLADTGELSPDPRQLRRLVAQHLLNLRAAPADRFPDLIARYRAVLASGVSDEPLDAAASGELAMLDAVGDHLPAFLARSLYRRPHLLNGAPVFDGLSPRLAVEVLDLLLNPPLQFAESGDARRYVAFLVTLAGRVQALTHDDPAHPLARAFIDKVAQGPAYLAADDLKTLQKRKAALIESVLSSEGAVLDWSPETRSARSRLRLGLLVDRLDEHPDVLAVLPFLRAYDRGRFDVRVFAVSSGDPAWLVAVEAMADEVCVLPDITAEAVAVLRARDLDVLLLATDIASGASRATRIAAHRSARVQVAGLASPVTSGLARVDAFVSGTLTDTGEDAPVHYAERLIRMPGTGFCYGDGPFPKPTPPPASRAALGIPDGAVVFVSGADLAEIGPETRRSWSAILASVPEAVLILHPFGAGASQQTATRLFLQAMERDFAAWGIAPDRVRYLRGVTDRALARSVLAAADVALDPFPYSRPLSVLDAIECGLPVVARRGLVARAQAGAAMLLDLGLPELVATDDAGYVGMARRLGTDAVLRHALRDKIRSRLATAPGFLDAVGFARKLETAILTLHPVPEPSATELVAG